MIMALESDEVKVGGPIPDEKVCLAQTLKYWLDMVRPICENIHCIEETTRHFVERQ